jgi:hypothetical protein
LLEEIGKGVKGAFFVRVTKILSICFIIIMLSSFGKWFYLPLEYRVQLVSMTCLHVYEWVTKFRTKTNEVNFNWSCRTMLGHLD